MDALQFEPMSVGQIIDKTFWLWRKNFVRYIALVGVMLVPLYIIQLMIQFSLFGSPDPRELQSHAIFFFLIVFLLSIIGQNLSRAALIKSISQSYMGKETTVGEAYGSMLPRLGSIIWASILVGLVCSLGFVLLVVPGVIFSLWFALTIPVLLLENIGATAAMGRSKALVAGNLGKVFIVGLVVGLITFIIGGIFGYIGGLLAGPVVTHMSIFVNGLFSLIGQIISMPIAAGAYILLYYDLRIRKEGFDLEMLARGMGQEPEKVNAPPAP